jgi:cytochrome c-type biogenesis protein
MAQSIRKQTSLATPLGGQKRPVHPVASSRWIVFSHALAFVAGFTLVFTLIGSAAGVIGQSLNQYLPLVQQLGAILLAIFALVTLGVFRWLVQRIEQRADLPTNPAARLLVKLLEFFNTLLYTEKRVAEMHTINQGWGYYSSFLLGVSFSAGWVPCVGPILAGIFFLASDSATAGQGATLLAIYSLGLGIPFLITGFAFSTMTQFLRRLNRYANSVGIISGIFLLFVAWLLWTGSLTTLTNRFDFISKMMLAMNTWVTAGEDWVVNASGTGGDVMGMSVLAAAPLAFVAGIISFVSPCVLPLVPAYIGYLSGAAVSTKSE